MDDALVVAANRLACRWTLSRAAVSALARWLAWVEVTLMVVLALSGRRGAAVRMLIAVGGVYLASEVLGQLWPRERPFSRLSAVEGLVPHDSRRSFPSRHVASGLAMAGIGGAEHTRLGATMSLVAIGLGLGRVAAGLHYPGDVLGGVVLGALVGRLLRTQS